MTTTATAPNRTKGQHQSNSNSVTMPAPEDGNVLKKVISFTLDQMNNGDGAIEKPSRPSFVPEKLHFSAYEQFKGEFTIYISLTLLTSIVISHIHKVMLN